MDADRASALVRRGPRGADLILILHAEHSLNASTFAARVITATLSDVYSAVTGAIGALKGPLHGGADTEVLKTLRRNRQRRPGSAAWVEGGPGTKEKFMGFRPRGLQDERTRGSST